MAKKTNFGSDFWLVWPKFGTAIFFSWILLLLNIMHCCELSFYAISRKAINQTQENSEKPHFGPDLCPLGPNSGRKNFFFRYGFVSP